MVDCSKTINIPSRCTLNLTRVTYHIYVESFFNFFFSFVVAIFPCFERAIRIGYYSIVFKRQFEYYIVYLLIFRQNVYNDRIAGGTAHVRDHTVRHFVAVQRNTRAKVEDRSPFLGPRVRRRGVRTGLSRQRPAGRPVQR